MVFGKMHNRVSATVTLVFLTFLPETVFSNTIPSVTEVVAQQRSDGSGIVDVHFALHEADGDLMAIRLFLSEDGGMTFPIECLSTTPPPGSSFQSGENRYLAWNALADYPGHQSDYIVRVQADDGQTVDPGSFVLLPSGSFFMGTSEDEYGNPDEFPQHEVTLTHPFHIQNTEVTNQRYMEMAQWAYDHGYCTATSSSLRDNLDGSTTELLDLDDGDCEISFSGDTFTVDPEKEDHPVKEVTWYGSVAYCDWLSLQAGLPQAYDHSTWECNGGDPYNAQGFRLPTEAEWEYSCRAGMQTPFNTGICLDADTEANYRGEYPWEDCPPGPYVGWTVDVGSYVDNNWNLYDMHGNLQEWCNDWYYGAYYSSSPDTDPVGPDTGPSRVIRSGGFSHFAMNCRSAYRVWSYFPDESGRDCGFRPVRTAF